ncbi:MAG: hypothetical protein V4541_05825 [Bacteroidota bacterium]
MKKKLIFICWLSIVSIYAAAQTTRPAVLVIGNSNAAAAAGIQAAISGVKTIILLQAGGFDISPIKDEMSSGVQAEFIEKMKRVKGKDSSAILDFDKQTANNLLSTWTDTLKNLTIIKNVTWIKAERSGNNWVFKLSDGKIIKPTILINAGDAKLQAALKLEAIPVVALTPVDYRNTLYRTSVSADKTFFFSMYNFFIPGQENLLWLKGNESMLIGQAAGATAAYSGFFSIKTSLSNLKSIQGELVNYKLALMPFVDIKLNDPNWKAIQMVGITGVIEGETDNNGIRFLPEKLITTDEIKAPLKAFYYKAQIWFDDYKNSQMTIGSAIDMICYVGNKAVDNTPKEIAKKWKSAYKFNTDFDVNRQITRRELAVLLQDYMPPFNVNIDKTGKVVR